MVAETDNLHLEVELRAHLLTSMSKMNPAFLWSIPKPPLLAVVVHSIEAVVAHAEAMRIIIEAWRREEVVVALLVDGEVPNVAEGEVGEIGRGYVNLENL